MPVIPLAHFAYRGLTRLMPEGDQRVFSDPDIEAMFIDDIIGVLNAKVPMQAMLDDARLFGRDWGFRLSNVKVPVRWWHGDADSIIMFDDAKKAVSTRPSRTGVDARRTSHTREPLPCLTVARGSGSAVAARAREHPRRRP